MNSLIYQALDIPEGLSGEAITGGEDCHGKLSAINSDATSDMSPVRAHNFNHSTEQLPIQLEALVGKGRFAEVWRARLHHQAAGSQYETVAVKVMVFPLPFFLTPLIFSVVFCVIFM